MATPVRILLQTTIPPTPDDWHIGRFSLLRDHLASLRNVDGGILFDVVARDRADTGAPDPVLSTLDRSDSDQLWLFAVDVGDGLTAEDCAAITRFRERGGGLMVTRDHMDLGSSICSLGGVGKAHYFHSRQLDPDAARHIIDDHVTSYILWPNYHSGANGDFQEIVIQGAVHPLLLDSQAKDGVLRILPSHPHEGAVGAPPDEPAARVIATGKSKVTGASFNIAVAFEPVAGVGPGLAESTFHHFCDYNWDTASGCPTFVSEPAGDGIARSPVAQRAIRRYATNVALWLSGQSTTLPVTVAAA
jgi:hypothetical protein